MSVEVFYQDESQAESRTQELRERGLEVAVTSFEGGVSLTIDGEEVLLAPVRNEVFQRQQAEFGRELSGRVLWWRDEKGYGRIQGDDGYVYFCHFSALQIDGYKTLREGERVQLVVGGIADHGRLAASSVRPW